MEERTAILKRAALVSLDRDVDEVEELARTAGYEVVYEIVQRRKRPEPSLYIGRGKVEEIKELLAESPVEAIIINGEAKPSHHYNLESLLGVECVDRIRLILDIFKTRANNKESRLQVEKARLKYEAPLLKEWIHSAKAGEHPGFMGGGEYAIDVYYDLIKKRIKSIDRELSEMRRVSDQKRNRRERNELFIVTLTGYTNAGKSSLMRVLTKEDVLVEDRMFSTLSTTTRSLSGEDILIVDTIGFIKNLPYFMIESFRNTIEEVFYSDLVLLVIDCSDPLDDLRRKLNVSLEILLPRIDKEKIIIILNKIDKKSNKNQYFDIENLIFQSLGDVEIVRTSAKEMIGIEELKDRIQARFKRDVFISVSLPNLPNSQSNVSRIFDLCDVLSCEYSKNITIKGKCHLADVGKIEKIAKASGGRRLRGEK
ncbi:MAG: GTPase HflX [Methanomassiliicoccales archaeon]|nr:MAG: GTPase HflX [Methanomassiliicoccales archaeon]